MSGVTPFVVAVATAFAGTQPQLTAVGNQVYVTFGHGDTISVARSADGGKSFGAPVALPSQGRLSLGMHRGPRIAGTGRALLVAAVVGSRGGGADGDVVLFRSSDRGATWSSPIVINDVAGAAREGLHALAASPSGLVVAAWLDLRHGGTRIYAAVSRDHGASWAADRLVYSSPGGSVCECCHPSVAISGAGEIAVMFRNSIDGNRDLYAARSARGATFAPASKLGISSWALKACPMDGGAVAFDGANIAAIWRRENNVFLTTAKAPEQRLARGRDPALSQGQPSRHGLERRERRNARARSGGSDPSGPWTLSLRSCSPRRDGYRLGTPGTDQRSGSSAVMCDQSWMVSSCARTFAQM